MPFVLTSETHSVQAVRLATVLPLRVQWSEEGGPLLRVSLLLEVSELLLSECGVGGKRVQFLSHSVETSQSI